MHFNVKKDAKGEYRWQLIAGNNVDIIADSGEGYKNKADCVHGMTLVMDTDRSTTWYDYDKV